MMKTLSIYTFCLFIGLMAFLSNCGSDDSQIPEYNHDVDVGQSAKDLISGSTYKYLIVEMQYMPAHKPTDRGVEEFKVFLEKTIDKPGGVFVYQKEIASEGLEKYSLDKLKEIEDVKRAYYTSGDTIATYFLFVDGDYQKNTENKITLGVAHQNTSMAIFQKTIKESTGGLGKPRQDIMEATVLDHEFGHILGLVNINKDMVSYHEDKNHLGHCENEECLMYWTVGAGSFVQDLVGRQLPPNLDKACLMDIDARK